jgi:hypothetical protein
MAKFRITADGAVYDIEAPDESQAMAALDEMRGGAPAATAPSVAADVGHAIPSGAASGVALAGGTPTGLGDLAQQGMDWARRKVTGKTEQQEKDEAKATVGKFLDFLGAPKVPMNEEPVRVKGSPDIASTTNLRRLGDAAMGEYGPSYEPQTSLGKFAKAGTEGAVAGAMVPAGGGVGMRSLQGLTSGVGSEAAGQLTGDNPWAKVGGGVAGAFAPSALSRLINPIPISSARQASDAVLKKEGVTPTAGQLTGREWLKYREAASGGSVPQKVAEEQGRGLAQATMRRIGSEADTIAPEMLGPRAREIGALFDDVSSRNVMIPDSNLGQAFGRVAQLYDKNANQSTKNPAVANAITDLLQKMSPKDGTISGEAFQAWRSEWGKSAYKQSDTLVAGALDDVIAAADDAMERSIGKLNPADLGAWSEARRLYKNLQVVKKIGAGGSPEAAEGMVTPGGLRQAVIAKQGEDAYALGRGEFSELSRAANHLMKPLPNSGTPGRLMSHVIPGGVAGASVAGAVATGNPALLLGTLPEVANLSLMTRPVQAYLKSQLPIQKQLAELLAGRVSGGGKAALAQALMRGSAVQPRE